MARRKDALLGQEVAQRNADVVRDTHAAEHNLFARPQQVRRLFQGLSSLPVLVSYNGSQGVSLGQDILDHWQIHIDILTYAGS